MHSSLRSPASAKWLEASVASSLRSQYPNASQNVVLDSLSTLKLVTFLEEHFKIELEANDLDAGNLSSIASIADLVASKSGSR